MKEREWKWKYGEAYSCLQSLQQGTGKSFISVYKYTIYIVPANNVIRLNEDLVIANIKYRQE